MNAPKWTPGPWSVQRAGTGEVYIEGAACVDPVTNARPVIVAQIPSTCSPNPMWRQVEEQDANAALIALAPEMAEALRAVVACFSEDGEYNAVTAPYGTEELRSMAAALLAKLDNA